MILKLLKTHKIDLIIDVGASDGYYANALFELGFEGRIISFEPLSTAYNKLLKRSKSNSNWEIAERCAIGNINGKININISKNSVSSSVLQIMESHINAEPESICIGSEEVNIYRLDSIATKYISTAKNIFLKLDVQGFEDKVIEGSADILEKIRGIQLEMSLIKLYNEQLLFEEMLKKMINIEFELYSLYPVFTDKKTMRLLQVDGIFFKS
jgi:FkbM family methyltransferase